jgi:flagellar assembly protein FliH
MHVDEKLFVPEVECKPESDEFELLPGVHSCCLGLPVQPAGGARSTGADVYEQVAADAYRKGFEQGLAQAQDFKFKANKEITALLQEMQNARRAMLVHLESELVKLSVEIARKVIKREVDADIVRCLGDQVAACLKQLDRGVPVVIRLNPADVQLLDELLTGDRDTFAVLDGVRLIGDMRVERGGCIMETERTALRATISEQLDKLSKVLEREYGRSITAEVGSTPLGDT